MPAVKNISNVKYSEQQSLSRGRQNATSVTHIVKLVFFHFWNWRVGVFLGEEWWRLSHSACAWWNRDSIRPDDQDTVNSDSHDDKEENSKDEVQSQDDFDHSQDDVDGYQDALHPHPRHYHGSLLLSDALNQDCTQNDIENSNQHVHPSLTNSVNPMIDAIDSVHNRQHQSNDADGQRAGSQAASTAALGQKAFVFPHSVSCFE